MDQIKSHFTRHGIHYAVVLFFYALAAMLLSKSFDGYVVRQGDIENFLGMSKEVADSRVLFDESPGWTNAMFGGMPTTQISPDKPPFDVVTSIRRFFNVLTGYGGITLFLMAMLGGGTCWRLPWGSVLGWAYSVAWEWGYPHSRCFIFLQAITARCMLSPTCLLWLPVWCGLIEKIHGLGRPLQPQERHFMWLLDTRK